jgi:NTE family protein
MHNVAIACQGGGSHTAFTAGALSALLPWVDSRDCRLVGMSGTSGGAICGTVAWSHYLQDGADGAVAELEALWDDIAAAGPMDEWLNQVMVWNSRAKNSGAPLPSVSPYHLPFEGAGKREFRRIIERHVDFDALPELVDDDAPRMVVGTVDVGAGEFDTFEDAAITADALLASAAIPTLFEGVEIDGDLHWDGLFSQNPPVRQLMEGGPGTKPDELWVIQINPQRSDEHLKSLEAIHDRRNELSGNLSLNQELRFIEVVNEWVENGDLTPDRYKHTEVRRLILDADLGHASKLDRDSAFLDDLQEMGRENARSFLDEVEADLFEAA